MVFSFIGWSGTGKTTIVVQLIKDLTARGYSVAAIKSSHHEIQPDKSGSDSLLFTQSGARAVALAHEGGVNLFLPKMDWTMENLHRYFPGEQIILGEGLKTNGAFRILVSGNAKTQNDLKGELDSYDAILTDNEDLKKELDAYGPVLPQSNLTPLINLILNQLKPID